jgi:hypothetical protein
MGIVDFQCGLNVVVMVICRLIAVDLLRVPVDPLLAAPVLVEPFKAELT